MLKTRLLIAERCKSKWWHKKLELMICESRLKIMTIFDSSWSLRLRMLWLFLQCIWKIRMFLSQLKSAFLWCHLCSCLLCSFMSLCFRSHLIHFCWWLLLFSHLWRRSRSLLSKRWKTQWALIWASYFIHSVNMIACACFVLSD